MSSLIRSVAPFGRRARLGVTATLFAVCCLHGCAKGAKAPTLCYLGWWLASPAPCACSTVAECGQPDCQILSVQGFRSDGSFLDLVLATSKANGTMSSYGLPGEYSYSVSNGVLTITGPQGSAKEEIVSCTSTQINLNYTLQSRASQPLTQSLEKAASEGSLQWKSVPFAL
jgi:hypothetical protein